MIPYVWGDGMKVSRKAVNAFCKAHNWDPGVIAQIEISPECVWVRRFRQDDEGRLILNHFGPDTIESCYSYKEDA